MIELALPIVDPHHHLWPPGKGFRYAMADLHADAASGHNVTRTVFVECGAAYRDSGPADYASVGETEFVAAEAAADPTGLIGGIVAYADLRLPDLDAILDAHEAASQGLFRGIRDRMARAIEPEALMIAALAPKDLYLDPEFQAGVSRLAARGLTFDAWLYHYQLNELVHLARAVPETTIVLDHFATPLGVGSFAAQRDEIFEIWTRDITRLASCDNVVVKLGGMAMPDNGFGWNAAERPPTSDEFIAAQSPYYEHTIQAFGPTRCMFESNFPVDRLSLSYRTFWNACKKMTSGYSQGERTEMFSGTASRIYRVELREAAPTRAISPGRATPYEE